MTGSATVVEPATAGLLVDTLGKVLLGHEAELRLVVAALLAGEHVLVEDAPGTGKTLLARSLATVIGAHHRRVQATPDLLPADVTGTSVFHPGTAAWEFRPGPVFTNILLVDELNRASPRAQSALLEPMEERQVTVDGQPRALPDPFLLIATQNPLGDAGTFPLPASQLDRARMDTRRDAPDRRSLHFALSGDFKAGVDQRMNDDAAAQGGLRRLVADDEMIAAKRGHRLRKHHLTVRRLLGRKLLLSAEQHDPAYAARSCARRKRVEVAQGLRHRVGQVEPAQPVGHLLRVVTPKGVVARPDTVSGVGFPQSLRRRTRRRREALGGELVVALRPLAPLRDELDVTSGPRSRPRSIAAPRETRARPSAHPGPCRSSWAGTGRPARA